MELDGMNGTIGDSLNKITFRQSIKTTVLLRIIPGSNTVNPALLVLHKK